LPLADNYSSIEESIEEKGLDMYQVQSQKGFLVSFSGTSIELSHKLGITGEEGPGQLGPALVVVISSYYGRASTTMWEWMKSRMERSS